MIPIIPAVITWSAADAAGFTLSSPDLPKHLRLCVAAAMAGAKNNALNGMGKKSSQA